MYRNVIGLLMILLSSFINFSGQLLIRRASGELLSSDTNQDMKLIVYLSLIRKLFPPPKAFVLGAVLFFIALCIWVFALGFIRFSVGFPIYVSLSIFFLVLYSIIISKEGIELSQYLGLGLLVLAVILLARKG